MFLNSIRWRLQIWYGVILVSVLAGFGVTAYQLERGRQLRGIDEDLQRRMSALMAGLGKPGPEGRGPEGRFGDRPPPPEDPMRDGPPDGNPDDGPPGQHHAFRLSPAQAGLFGGGGKSAFYYVIWRRDGTEMTRSANAPPGVIRPRSAEGSAAQIPRTRGSFREVSNVTPLGDSLVAGRAIDGDLADLRRFGWALSAVGGVVLLFGLAGGWWLGTRAIRPIEDISATAQKIAGGDLAQRIDITDTENELGRLAGVLNSTFARLEAAFAQQGQFTADAAHELRTPVSVILMQTQTALKRDRTAVDYRETVEACHRSAQKMRRLLESLLELARLDAGQEPMKRRRFDLAATVVDCVESVQPLAAERGVKILSDLPPLEFQGDSDRLAQVITNLLTNAINYNKEDGEVRVSVARENGAAVVTVADTGLGISAADLPHVFERFYRADKARSGMAGHTGLGLAISKAIVNAHGGSLEVASEPGQGTTFVMRLPATV